MTTTSSATPILSVQLYTLRTLGDVDGILSAVAAAGYRHVELVGSHLENAKPVAEKLAQYRLKPSSAHVSMAALRADPEKVLNACSVLGLADIFMPSVPADERQSPAEYWRALGAELAGVSDTFAKSGVRLGYHNHDWELAQKGDGKTALDHLFEGAGTSPLAWEADIAWIVRGGADPEALLSRYSSRVTAVHVKDLAPSGENVEEAGWADVGSGVLDWHALWPVCVASGARLMVVEHDKPADPISSITNSFNYIAKMGA